MAKLNDDEFFHPKPRKRGPLFWLVAVVGVFFAGAAPIGIVAAIAVPNFQRFQNKARQSEAKVQLAGLNIALESYKIENGEYPADFAALNMDTTNARYAVGVVQPPNWIGPITPEWQSAAAVICPECTLDGEKPKLIAIGNIDNDEALDVWTYSNGEMINLQNDL